MNFVDLLCSDLAANEHIRHHFNVLMLLQQVLIHQEVFKTKLVQTHKISLALLLLGL